MCCPLLKKNKQLYVICLICHIILYILSAHIILLLSPHMFFYTTDDQIFSILN